jgi:aminodeoxyfutalosine deaminase
MKDNPVALRARYVFPVAGEPIRDGVVRIDAESCTILEVGRTHAADDYLEDLGNVAALPGFVNAHAHLESSYLASPLGYQGIPFTDWLRLLMASRRATAIDPAAAFGRGLRQCAEYSTVAVGDMVQAEWKRSFTMSSYGGVVAFRELIGPTRDRIAAAMTAAEEFCNSFDVPSTPDSRLLTPDSRLPTPGSPLPGLAPHAPYSVHPELLAAIIQFTQSRADKKIPISMHLAESAEELELLAEGRGPLRTFLEELGAWSPELFSRPMRPMDYLRVLSAAPRAVIAHGNYLDEAEIGFLGEHAARMSVVYCPRTHAWFGHRRYPLEAMLAAGVTVALGTDGRGSSPDFDMLEEMRCVARQFPSLGRDHIVAMATRNGAKALGLADELGTLEPGKRAALAFVSLPENDADPYELLLK